MQLEIEAEQYIRSLRIESQAPNEEKMQVRNGHDEKAGESQPGWVDIAEVSITAG